MFQPESVLRLIRRLVRVSTRLRRLRVCIFYDRFRRGHGRVTGGNRRRRRFTPIASRRCRLSFSGLDGRLFRRGSRLIRRSRRSL